MINSFCDLLKTCFENDLEIKISKESDRAISISIIKTFESEPGHRMRFHTALDPSFFELMIDDVTKEQVIFYEIEKNISQMIQGGK